ncbi:MAG TPA: HAMP domain-containing sensor histidine kinase, partial [Phenylobacterium sp.]|nr:HAMP domain-containing sensor histidine kinase [Phenylobacterium sp.]
EPGFDPALSGLLQIVALVTVVAAAAGALVWRQTRDERRERLLDTDLRKVADALSRQPGLLLDLGGDGRILAAYGAPAAGLRVVGHRLRDLVAPQGRPALAEAIARTLAEGQTTLSLTPADDAQGCLDLVLRRGADGRMGALVLDGAARRDREAELEAARQEAEAQNTGKSRFLANMSHELRTPLNAIMGFSDIMRSALFGPLPDRYGEYAQLIHESGEHLLELINDVLDMSKIEADRFELSREEFDAREAINAVLRLMRGQADRAGVHLVSNALKFTPRGGAVTVGLQGVAERMELVVADTGVGMSPEDLARVGRPYEQAGDAERRAAGTGLGLSLVRSFAELHQGEMFIESVQGEGTTVTVRLPVLLEPALGAGQPRGREVSASPAE